MAAGLPNWSVSTMNPYESPTSDIPPQTAKSRDISWITFVLCFVVTAFGELLLAKAAYHPLIVGGVLVQSLGSAFLTAVDFVLAGAIVLFLRYTVRRRSGGFAKRKKVIMVTAVIVAVLAAYGRM